MSDETAEIIRPVFGLSKAAQRTIRKAEKRGHIVIVFTRRPATPDTPSIISWPVRVLRKGSDHDPRIAC